MFRKILCVLLAVALANVTSAGLGWSDSRTDKQARTAEGIKVDVAKLGLGDKARVTVRLRNKSKLQGYISQKGEDSFSITDSKSGHTSIVAYRDVAEVNHKGLSKGEKITMIGVIVGIFMVVSILVGVHLDDN
jgi:hypothetical protein